MDLTMSSIKIDGGKRDWSSRFLNDLIKLDFFVCNLYELEKIK